MTGIDTVQSRLAEIRGMIDAWAGVTPTVGSASDASTAASSSAFASTLAAVDPTLAASDPTLAASGVAGTAATGSVTGAGLVQAAKAYLGVPYVWGGESSAGMDCSGLVQRAMADLGVSVPRTSQQQATIGTAVPSMSQALPGDLLVFDGGSHIGIYAGGGMMVVAPHSGTDVQMQKVYATPTTIRRVLPAQSTTSAAVTDPGLAAQLVTAASQRAALTLMTGSTGSTGTTSSTPTDSATAALDALVAAAGGTSATSVPSSQYSTLLSSLGVSA